MRLVEIGLLAAAGSAAQEVLWWYNRRHKLDEATLAQLIHSRGYWVVTCGFVIVTGLIGAAWFAGEAHVSARTCLLTGAAMPLLLKQGLTAVQPQQHLGAEREKFSLRDYLK